MTCESVDKVVIAPVTSVPWFLEMVSESSWMYFSTWESLRRSGPSRITGCPVETAASARALSSGWP